VLFTGIVIGLLLYGLYLATKCFFRVQEGHVAVLTSFGAAVREGDRLKTFRPGLHRKLPWQRVHVVPMMEQSVDLSGEEGGRTAMAEDGTVLRLDSILRYAPVDGALDKYLFGLRAPIDHVTGLFTCLLRNEIANFRPAAENDDSVGSYALIRRERRELNRRIEDFCAQKIGERYGVRFHAVDLVDILPPDELAHALNAVIQARSEADAAYARAESETQQRTLAAARGVEIARARAAAVETEIETLARFLQELEDRETLPLYVARRRAEVTSEARALYLKRPA
jgi:regulator of protease activity HflC (stomatin/prohibitin superfamily)